MPIDLPVPVDFNIEVLFPNGGEELLIGQEYSIQWKANKEIEYVDIYVSIVDYYSDTAELLIAEGVPSDWTESYYWVVGDLDSEHSSIRIVDSDNPDIFDESDGHFSIQYPEVIKVDFNYPEEWGDLTEYDYSYEYDFKKAIFDTLKDQGMDIFECSNDEIGLIWYHNPTKTLVFIERGEKVEFVTGTGFGYMQTLKVVTDEGIKTLFEEHEAHIWAVGGILAVNVSPNGEYVYYSNTGWEYSGGGIVNIKTGKDIFENYEIWYGASVYGDIFWSQDNEVLAIRSFTNAIGGYGIPGIFVSQYGDPEYLELVFRIEDVFLNGYELGNIYFEDDILFFSIVLPTGWDSDLREYAGEEVISSYEFNTKTRELKTLD